MAEIKIIHYIDTGSTWGELREFVKLTESASNGDQAIETDENGSPFGISAMIETEELRRALLKECADCHDEVKPGHYCPGCGLTNTED